MDDNSLKIVFYKNILKVKKPRNHLDYRAFAIS